MRDDPVDQSLGEYLNAMDEPLPVLFVREAHGIYGFGMKRIFLKIEQGKLIGKLNLLL